MDDDEDNFEESDLDIPGIPDESSSQIVLKSVSEASKAQSLLTPAPENRKTPSMISKTQQDSPSGSPSSQPSEELQEPLEEKVSKSQEEFRQSQDLSLNGKKTSLDQLSTDKTQKVKTNKMYRQCQRRFKEIIGKRELKNEELEKQQGDLKQRLNILECSMPAVMVWNIWRMTQGACVPNLQRVMEKQFEGPASGEVYCPSTPSRHFDCRVREVEAERKQAEKRTDEARTLWAEKMAALEDRSRKLEEAKKLQENTRERIQQLTDEAQRLKELASKVPDDGSCETGECGIIECKKKWLEKVPSSASIKSTDIECLEKLQQLAENELYMKRQIADLERREEAYMRTLQQADELWCKIEGDEASTMSALQEQLGTKTAENQQMADRISELEDVIEQLRARLANCRGELEKYISVSKIEALIGKDDDFADVLDKGVVAESELKDEMIGREDDIADVGDIGVLSKEEMEDKDTLAQAELSDAELSVKPDLADADSEFRPDMADADSEFKPDTADAELEMKPDVDEAGLDVSPETADHEMVVYRTDLVGVDDAQMGIHPDDFAYEDERLQEAREYLARLGSLSELDKYGDDYVCAPDFICNDLVFSETGLTEEEWIALKENRVTAQMLLEKAGMPVEVGQTIVAESVEVAEVSGVRMRTVLPREGAVRGVQEVPEELMGETVQDGEESETLSVEEARMIDTDVKRREQPDLLMEESGPVEEYRVHEDTSPTEEFKAYEDTSPIEKSRMYKDAAQIEETRAYEGTGPTEKSEAYEDSSPAEEPKIYEDTSQIKEFKAYRDAGPTVESRVYKDTSPAEKVRPVEGPMVDIRPAKDTRPIQEDVPPVHIKVETEGPESVSRYPEGTIDKNNILVPRNEMLSWQDDVDTIRSTIAKCPECVVVKKEADNLATSMAAYTGTEVKDIVERPRPPEERSPTETQIEIQTKPDVTEAEVTATAKMEEKEVEAKGIAKSLSPEESKIESQEESPATPLVPTAIEKHDDDTIPEAVPKPEETPAVPVKEDPTKMPAVTEEIDEAEIPVKEKDEEAVKTEKKPLQEDRKEEESGLEMAPVKEEKVEAEEEEKMVPGEEEELLPAEKEEMEVKVKVKDEEAESVPEEEKEEVEVKIKVKDEEEEPVLEEETEEVEPEIQKEVVGVELLPEEGAEIKKEPEEPEEEEGEIVVPLDIKEEIPEEEKIDVDVEVLSEEAIEGEPKEVEVEPTEEKVPEVPVFEEPQVSVSEEELVIPCTCEPQTPPPEPAKKIEITQTEITRIETIQVITQTVADVETQTTPRIIRQSQQPKLITYTKAVDPDSETIQRLLSYAKPLREQTAAMTFTESSQAHRTASFRMKVADMGSQPPYHPLSNILQSLRAEGAQMRPGPEQELRSIYYGKKSGDLDQGKCNCCQCGRTMATPISGSRAQIETQQPASWFKMRSGLPMSRKPEKSGYPSTDQAVQHEAVCPECKIRKLQETLKAQDPLKKVPKKPMRDQEVCTCAAQLGKGQPVPRMRKRSDQGCMAKIPKAKGDRTSRREFNRMEAERDEDQESVRCACSGLIETGKPGVFKKVHCACGDPD